ncbi:protein ripply3 isoform X3 [Hyla sarda]|uniref:protein ripply3 isoform X3 n=1 Tax=Hyla sarda TaxID=327740 RepID=UPI0024C37FB9|nr:protein ripply3 isoform X3 [Hyla sarda]XP_056416879.1 protein ripply3 isoform X3 [Hyla sarda]XP_056416880.1 protein ripply3 isoform X3 [Hyla sarda]
MDSAHYTLKAAVAHMCHCPGGRNRPNSMHPGQGGSNSALWRPWVFSSMDSTSDTQQKLGRMTDSDNDNAGKKGALGFQHPVRLYMPKSKTEEYLQHMGKKVLASFPVQATIHFYNDDSDSEEEDDYGMDYYNYYQNYKGREDQSMAEEDSAYSSGTDQSAK